MAAAEAARLLDELMGRNRNLPSTDLNNSIRWNDDEVCKYYLVSFCPHDLFVNTKADLGPCAKLHDDNLKAEYVNSPRFEKMGYEDEFLRSLQSMINDVERRIKRGHQRLNLSGMGGQSVQQTQSSAKEEKVKILTERINELIQEAENLGCEGKVEEAQGVMKLCDQLTEERSQMENETVNTNMPQMKEMEVCEVCGAFLIVGDAKQRAEEHLMGKQHMGYAKVRKYVADAQDAKRQKELEREQMWQKEREARELEREKERQDRQRKREEREKERQERRRRSRSRHRSHSRERRGRRSRSRDKDSRRRRDHDRSRRSRSRDRRRSRSRDRSSRSSHSDKHQQQQRSDSKLRDHSREPSNDAFNDSGPMKGAPQPGEDKQADVSSHDHSSSAVTDSTQDQ
ncbi:luc7-like protein 3 [Tubulanus polymorphus]|uniref:luc7-like protein 3 n=1 Tax=Tubulanus polymorphus TaxID=672921 RepID=UPI003DA1CC44